MLDINLIRNNPELIRKDLDKRQANDKLQMLDEVIELDSQWRKTKAEGDGFRQRRNQLSMEINQAKKNNKDASHLLKEAKELPDKIKDIEAEDEKLRDKINFILMRLPNILHSSVPAGPDSTGNVVVRQWGKAKKQSSDVMSYVSHGELLQSLGLADFEKAAKISGAGFNFLIGDLALLDIALQRFAIDILLKKGFTLIAPPYMLRRKPYEGVTDLADFETMMYKIDGEELYLIATSEHPIAALHMNEVFDAKDLPKKYMGMSPCFRKEIGSHGVDEKGLFRVHQFNKIEQFVFCNPEDSWSIHEELLANAEEIFKKLKLPYRVVNICTGDIGIVAAKKYDLEVWMPREQEYKEAVSCSNCTSYQAARLNIRYQDKDKRDYLHTLNSTALAVQRTIRAIVENYQNKDGTITVPNALVPYMNKKKVIGND